ncbi:hypothetical protein KBB12_02585 [Candidatus Woesebacteria bacterium]|nr:hypothetical protein [Candidatus Woesebacteria bacterium]
MLEAKTYTYSQKVIVKARKFIMLYTSVLVVVSLVVISIIVDVDVWAIAITVLMFVGVGVPTAWFVGRRARTWKIIVTPEYIEKTFENIVTKFYYEDISRVNVSTDREDRIVSIKIETRKKQKEDAMVSILNIVKSIPGSDVNFNADTSLLQYGLIVGFEGMDEIVRALQEKVDASLIQYNRVRVFRFLGQP